MLPSSWSRTVPLLSSLAAEERRGRVIFFAYKYERCVRFEQVWVLGDVHSRDFGSMDSGLESGRQRGTRETVGARCWVFRSRSHKGK